MTTVTEIVAVANMAGYLEHADKIYVSDDETLAEFIVSELEKRGNRTSEDERFFAYFNDRLIDEYGVKQEGNNVDHDAGR